MGFLLKIKIFIYKDKPYKPREDGAQNEYAHKGTQSMYYVSSFTVRL